MKKILLLVFLSSLSAKAQQGFESLMTRRVPNCVDIAYNCTYLFEKYISQDMQDSARMLLNYWQGRCRMEEMMQRTKILYALRYHTYADSCIDDHALYYMRQYRDLVKYLGTHSPADDESVFRGFDDYTLSLSRSLKNEYEEGTIEHLLCRFYSGEVDSALSEIRKPHYASSKIHRLYLQEVNRCNQIFEGHWAAMAGMWIPTGGATRLGVHPQLGIQGGVESGRFTADGTLLFRFLDTPSPYMAWNPQLNVTTWTNYYLGFYMGADFGYRLNTKGENGVYVLAGIGYDGFDAFSYDYEDVDNAPTADSFNFNFGSGYRVALKNGKFIGLQVKYNVVDYSHSHIVEFTGNTVTVDIVFGGVTQDKKRCLQCLENFSSQ